MDDDILKSRSQAAGNGSFRLSPLILTLLYFGAGALWLLSTDLLVGLLITDSWNYIFAQMLKGSVYIISTAFLIYWLARRGKSALNASFLRRELIIADRTLHAVLESIGEGVIIVDPEERRILDCNEAAGRIFGYHRKADLVGRPTEVLHVDREHFDEFGRASESELQQHGLFRTEFRMRRRDGGIIDTDNSVTPVHPDLGWRAGVVSVVQDISNRKAAERQLKESLQEKRVMLGEINHRVKNNLAVISSLLQLQTRMIQSPEQAVRALHNSYNRILAMSLVHEELYSSSNFLKVNMHGYIERFLPHIRNTVPQEQKIIFDISFSELMLDVSRAIPCALIINELVSNSLLHAFPDGGEGRIALRMEKRKESQCELMAEDDGVGLPPGIVTQYEAGELGTSTLGFSVVSALLDQIGGTLSLESSEESGTRVSVVFPIESF